MKTRYRTQQVGFLNKRTIIVLQLLKTVPHPHWWIPSKQNVTVEVWMDAVPEDLINTVARHTQGEDNEHI